MLVAHEAYETRDGPDIGPPRPNPPSSAPTSNGSAWTRTISAPRHRREERHLVARLQRRVLGHVILVHRTTHHAGTGQRLGEAGVALGQVGLERRDAVTSGGSSSVSSAQPTRCLSQAK